MKIHIPAFNAMAEYNAHLKYGPIDIDLGPDVVRVVRCKDCEYYEIEKKHKAYCTHHLYGLFDEYKPNDFCSYGARRKEE